jgi:acetyl esterase/lipase
MTQGFLEILKQLLITAIDIIQNYGADKDLNSENWGLIHGTSVKLIKSTLMSTNTIPMSVIQSLSTSCKYFGWPGLQIERTTVPGRFREQAYQFMRKYFEEKYGQYPVPTNYNWNSSVPLNIQWITPKNRTMSNHPPTLYHIHGGAWALAHSCIYNHVFRDLTEASSGQVMTIEYRLLPQYPLLSQLEDIFAGYFYLTAPESNKGAGNTSTQIVVGGESSGGQLAASFLHILRNENLPSPVGAYLISPAADLTLSQPSFFNNSKRDILWNEDAPSRLDSSGFHLYSNLNNALYSESPKIAIDRMKSDGSPFGPKEIMIWPELSPVFDKNMDNLPPTFVIVGERDSLRDFGILYGKLRAKAEIKSKNKTTIIPNIQTYGYEDMVHAFPILPSDKYTKKALKAMSEFIYQALNANNQRVLSERKYEYLPDYKTAYMYSTYNMYWNNIYNQYIPWNSTYEILPFPTENNFTAPSYIIPAPFNSTTSKL